MKILLAIQSGFSRSFRSWKGILIFWFISFATVSMLVLPIKAGLNTALGQSMVTEKLANGINMDVLGDLGKNLRLIGSTLFAGVIGLAFAAVVIDVFIAGGLFSSVGSGSDEPTSENIFRASSKKFWPFLLISLVIYMILILLFVFLIIIPASIAGNAESAPEGIMFRTLAITIPFFILAVSVILLVADYSRAWQTAGLKNASFRALGFGFSQTFKTIFPSFGLMIIMLLLQVLVGWLMIKIIAGFTPATGKGVVLLFVVSQILLIIKFFLKVVRYASVTSLMELNSLKEISGAGNPVVPAHDALSEMQHESVADADAV